MVPEIEVSKKSTVRLYNQTTNLQIFEFKTNTLVVAVKDGFEVLPYLMMM
jgi:hypothetical protein